MPRRMEKEYPSSSLNKRKTLRLKSIQRTGLLQFTELTSVESIHDTDEFNKFSWQWKGLYRLNAKSWNGSSNIHPTYMF